jgi:hypothetical protein
MSLMTTAFFDRDALLLMKKDKWNFENNFNCIHSRNSQAPGPVGKTVSIPLRKSGIPVDVDTPAPKKVNDYLEL